ncbi:TIR domain-containing adapter molecule 1 isoform X2 [Alligator sinensis]|uniref:TIR domain-containing adapter molecule 1 n=1 Tax=Alligator sinensis TaxID=38654 RepID=A0A3Q0G1N7_ALLSI|nr:TIR domain-containing adapter molecule 1 isoform X1 [Alligator sinensis]XP_025052285.1 TIR domain-containing adapter molecule 1 isoform X2 [Alligator sinensis]
MAERAETQPTFEDVFSLLSRIPENRLVSLKHKLKHMRPSTSSSKLLHAMVLLALGREAEARICLDALGEDTGALYVCRTRLGSAGVPAGCVDPGTPQLDASALWVLAQIYSLLVEEKVCSQEAKIRAYRAAIQAARASKGSPGERLSSLLAEAQVQCGMDISLTERGASFETLRSDPTLLQTASPASVPRSAPVQIGSRPGLSGPRTLHSSGSPASFVSHFEISQSPTVEYMTHSTRRHHNPGPSKLCGGSASLAVHNSGGSASHVARDPEQLDSASANPLQSQPRSRSLGDPCGGSSCHPSLPVPETGLPSQSAMHCPVECSDLPSTVPPPKPQRPQAGVPKEPEKEPHVGLPGSSSSAIRLPVEDSYVPTGHRNMASSSSSSSICPPPLQPPAPAPATAPSSEPDTGERKFFSFVVVHAVEDVDIACRVKELLESMGVPDGATFCEDFLVPGHCQLTCFQDAINSSAFTLLLLTENFQCRLCTYQMNSALMDSILRLHKYNSVIPFVPKEYPLKKGQIPGVLAGLVPLDENSRVFTKRVKNTFVLSKIKEQRTKWSEIQQIQEAHRKQKQYQEHLQAVQQALAALNMGSQPGLLPPMQLPDLTGLQQFLSSLSAQAALINQPYPGGLFMPGYSAPSPSGLLPGHQNMVPGTGHQPLIIQNAQMVQIGDHNQMQVERTQSVSEDSDEETSECN